METKYIEKQVAIDALGEAPDVWTGSDVETSSLFQWERDKAAIEAVPSADAKPVVRGRWLWELADNGWVNYICSECHYTKNVDIHVRFDYNFCPNCGADMKDGYMPNGT